MVGPALDGAVVVASWPFLSVNVMMAVAVDAPSKVMTVSAGLEVLMRSVALSAVSDVAGTSVVLVTPWASTWTRVTEAEEPAPATTIILVCTAPLLSAYTVDSETRVVRGASTVFAGVDAVLSAELKVVVSTAPGVRLRMLPDFVVVGRLVDADAFAADVLASTAPLLLGARGVSAVVACARMISPAVAVSITWDVQAPQTGLTVEVRANPVIQAVPKPVHTSQERSITVSVQRTSMVLG